jgi:hypothetical protein
LRMNVALCTKEGAQRHIHTCLFGARGASGALWGRRALRTRAKGFGGYHDANDGGRGEDRGTFPIPRRAP